MMDVINADLINQDPFLLFFGSFYLVVGFSIFLASKHWQEFVTLMIEHESLSLVMGVLTLPIALFVIVFYNDWSSLASIVLMALGYIGLIKSLLLLLRPCWVQRFLNKGLIQKYLWVDGLSGILLGAALLLL